MSYTEKHLMDDETVVYQTKLNWSIYLKSAAILMLGLLGLFIFPGGATSKGFGILCIIIGLISAVMAFLKIRASEFVVTNWRVLIRVGTRKTEFLDTPLTQVKGIQVEQGGLEKLVNSGCLIIRGAEGSFNPFQAVDKPFDFRDAVNNQIAATRQVL